MTRTLISVICVLAVLGCSGATLKNPSPPATIPIPTATPVPSPTPEPTPTIKPKVLNIINNYRARIERYAEVSGCYYMDETFENTIRRWSTNSLTYLRSFAEVPDLTASDVRMIIDFLESEHGRHARRCRQ